MNPNPYSTAFSIEKVAAVDGSLNMLKVLRREAEKEDSIEFGPRTRAGNNKPHEAKHKMKKKKALAAQSRKRNRR